MRTPVAPLLLSVILLAGCATAPKVPAIAAGSRAELTILETTDVHSNVLSYDYYKLKADPTLGYERVATLIRQARRQYPNTVLFDAGDTIQGSVLADYQALVKPVACDQELAIYKAMDAIGYDAGTAGNHEFNYGLPFLAQVTGTPMDVAGVPAQRCAGPHFPIILSNVFSAKDGRPIFKPWTVITTTVTAHTPDGREVKAPVRIGLLGFTPPPIMDWDKRNLEGKVTVMGVVEAAKKYLPQLQARHPDLIVAIVHGGLSTAPYTPHLENAGWYLAELPGIDAMLLGHSHTSFPGPRFKDMPDVDDVRGTVHGVPAVMGGFFGKDLGLVHLQLHYAGGRWISDAAAARSEVRPICPHKGDCVAPDPRIAPLVAKVHAATIAYVNTPIGHTDFRMSTYFADLGDMSALSAVNAAQRDYVRAWIASGDHPALKGIPVLSAAAAFRTGFAGPDDYTDIAPGPLTIRSAADLYFYPNTLAAVRIDGAGLKAWLEKSAERFNRIDPGADAPQALVNSHFPGYNFDQIQGGIAYVIDVGKPAGQRISGLTFEGKPVRPGQPFIVVTNNYRASGGGHFPGMDGRHIVLSAPDGNREVLVHWLEKHPQLRRADLPPRPWHFAPLHARAPVTLVSAAGKLDAARAAGLTGLRVLKANGDGTATYAVDLGR
ncbi:MAG TPA: bifunctional 2',3'-cyclic-nucleotide 2'-phosphodiesterase/3'-nucleotidase [Rhodanobacteraceae bacterium]|nr:bifunctional 2',3'-cyclic-nucleotide 2'-phosphodiesterase/3'-nucleotidase [Rhodanobacteraceae bacterium]